MKEVEDFILAIFLFYCFAFFIVLIGNELFEKRNKKIKK